MQFVAFDLESTDGGFLNGNICEFGYCVANENFEIVEQNNILIRPTGNDNIAYYRIKLAYPLKVYYKSPTFVENYSKIGAILQKPDCVVIGHAIHNDIVGINAACKINTLKPFDFVFVDTQMLYSIFKQESKISSLDKIAEEIGAEFNHHRADEDARMSLLTLKYICEKENMTFEQLIAAYDANVGVNKNGEIVNFASNKCVSQAPSIHSKNSKRRILSMFEPKKVDESLIDKQNPLYHKKVFINREFFLDDIDLTRAILNRLAELGAKSVNFINTSNCYVGEVDESMAIDCEVLSVEQFLAMLGELEIVSYDDKTILEEYYRIKEEKKTAEKLALLNQKFKKKSDKK